MNYDLLLEGTMIGAESVALIEASTNQDSPKPQSEYSKEKERIKARKDEQKSAIMKTFTNWRDSIREIYYDIIKIDKMKKNITNPQDQSRIDQLKEQGSQIYYDVRTKIQEIKTLDPTNSLDLINQELQYVKNKYNEILRVESEAKSIAKKYNINTSSIDHNDIDREIEKKELEQASGFFEKVSIKFRHLRDRARYRLNNMRGKDIAILGGAFLAAYIILYAIVKDSTTKIYNPISIINRSATLMKSKSTTISKKLMIATLGFICTSTIITLTMGVIMTIINKMTTKEMKV